MPNSAPSKAAVKLRHGDVWLANLNPSRGTEPGKTRPVLIVHFAQGPLRLHPAHSRLHSLRWLFDCPVGPSGLSLAKPNGDEHAPGQHPPGQDPAFQARGAGKRRGGNRHCQGRPVARLVAIRCAASPRKPGALKGGIRLPRGFRRTPSRRVVAGLRGAGLSVEAAARYPGAPPGGLREAGGCPRPPRR